jgi:cytochrome c553
MILRLALPVAGLVLATSVQAQQNDVAFGERIATQGGGDAITACATCHGGRGEGTPGANFPRLAAQGAAYLRHQLDAYADGSRINPIMGPIAKAMSVEQRHAVAEYYAAADTPPTQRVAVRLPPNALERARLLESNGDNGRRVQACANCHGVAGRGMPPALPYLAGLDADYLRTALADWRSGARRSDASGMMPLIAAQLSEADIAALAGYFASLVPPKPVAASVRVVRDERRAASARPQRPGAGSVAAPDPSSTPGTGRR